MGRWAWPRMLPTARVSTDVVGVYLNPPDKAVVRGVDETSHVQALDRTQPGLPMKQGALPYNAP